MQVTSGLELLELRSIYSQSKTSKMPFSMLDVTNAFDLDEASFAELDTQDCGGPTRRYHYKKTAFLLLFYKNA